MTVTSTPAETAGLPWDENGGMYFDWLDNLWGDYDTPEENERAREIVRKMEGCADD